MKMTLLLVAAGLSIATNVNAQTKLTSEASRDANCSVNAMRILDSTDGDKAKRSNDDFTSIGFGAGYGMIQNLNSAVRVDEAALVNKIVRIVKDNDVQFGPLLETHKFMFPLQRRYLVQLNNGFAVSKNEPLTCARDKVTPVTLISVGPFVTLRIGGDEVVQTFGMGLMTGFRTAESDRSLNIGLAYGIDPSARILGDGIVEGKPLPDGETEIRYRTTHQAGLFVVFSVGW